MISEDYFRKNPHTLLVALVKAAVRFPTLLLALKTVSRIERLY